MRLCKHAFVAAVFDHKAKDYTSVAYTTSVKKQEAKIPVHVVFVPVEPDAVGGKEATACPVCPFNVNCLSFGQSFGYGWVCACARPSSAPKAKRLRVTASVTVVCVELEAALASAMKVLTHILYMYICVYM